MPVVVPGPDAAVRAAPCLWAARDRRPWVAWSEGRITAGACPAAAHYWGANAGMARFARTLPCAQPASGGSADTSVIKYWQTTEAQIC